MKVIGHFGVFLFMMVKSSVLCEISHNILCVFPVPSRSHGIMGKGVVESLLEAGHQVTWVTPFTDWEPKPNLTIISLPENIALATELKMSERSAEGMSFILEFGKRLSRQTIQNQQVRDVLVNQQFDAVVTEWFMTESDAGYAAIQQVPWILFSGVAMHPHMEFLVDDVRSVATLPLFLNDGPVPMSFWSRLVNSATLVWMFFWALPETLGVSDRYYSFFTPLADSRGVELPPFLSAVFNISILFVNSHPSVTPAQALPPNVIEVGGYHMPEEVDPLPKELQELMDNSTEGVIYFSMGSVFKSSGIAPHTARELAGLLGTTNRTVLWKYEGVLDDLPTNVHIRPWFPQDSVLAHQHMVLFVSHGGQLSVLETVRCGVPMLAVPVFGDQPANAARAARLGLARVTPWLPNHPSFIPTLSEQLYAMLEDEQYRKRAKELARVFAARPLPPRSLIAHYVDLTIRTKGAVHLRSASRLYPWWARIMLDQLAALAALFATAITSTKLLIATLSGGRKKTKTS